ncbi:hypothetical protein QJS10_CPA06g00390 [Acorus calamus]|uniref:DUF1771 domain-containing protein n=1 Tax=Acorus calamus TaxID=4465 RepID=A0AAV9EJP0_ACOCL|nr:hypothetical protein QJS10_CPA06g00390 [Acorus calamus]
MGSSGSELDGEEKALEGLLNAFGVNFSLEEIASAYCRANHDVNKAGEILFESQQSCSDGMHHAHKGETSGTHSHRVISSENGSERSTSLCNNSKGRHKKSSVSCGTISGVIGKGYAKHTPPMNGTCVTIKPMKLDVKEPLAGELMREGESDFMSRNEPISNKDIEEFLFSMLGEGFRLNMNVIREVLGSCGYDVKKSMEQLLVLSKGKNKIISDGTDACAGKSIGGVYDSANEDKSTVTSVPSEKTSDLSKEVLQALFSVPVRVEEEPKRIRIAWGLNRTRAPGKKVVTAPFESTDATLSTNVVETKPPSEDVVAEVDNYQALRKAAKLHWDAMKTYYEAAVEEFSKGNRVQANYLLKQGKFYNEKAREADEKSADEIFEASKVDSLNEMTLDLHNHHSREAVDLLKFHLHSLAQTLDVLKVIVDADAPDTTKGKRRRAIIKLLERESIKWTEAEGNPGTLYIRLDEIDPKGLNFVESTL